MVTAICNVYINSQQKYRLFQETFPRVLEISDNWLIYIRGAFAGRVVKYIKGLPQARQRCSFFENLPENDWATSTRVMLKQSRYDYIYLFLEDHFLIKPIRQFKAVLSDAKQNQISYFPYSFFNGGISTRSVELLNPDESKCFFIFELNANQLSLFQKKYPFFYPYSLVSVSAKSHFEKLLAIEKARIIRIPFYLQVLMEKTGLAYPRNRSFLLKLNKFTSRLGLRLTIYRPTTPFNLEKSVFDCDSQLLPLRIGILKEELFANWDDDAVVQNSSLIKRGLYPFKLKADNPSNPEPALRQYSLKAGEEISRQYCPETSRVATIPIKKLKVVTGKLRVKGLGEAYDLKPGEEIWLHANIPHTLEAREATTYLSGIAYHR